MITCSVCRHREMEGEIFCSECGARLAPNWTEQVPTAAFMSTSRLMAEAARAPAPAFASLRTGQIALSINGAPDALVLEGRGEYILGREGSDQVAPDVDLNPFGGREKGVSRVHAALRRDQQRLVLIDLGSTNGTRLNGRTLAAHQAERVENGDEIRLGKLSMTVNYLA